MSKTRILEASLHELSPDLMKLDLDKEQKTITLRIKQENNNDHQKMHTKPSNQKKLMSITNTHTKKVYFSNSNYLLQYHFFVCQV